ncbi:hypothetical protein CA13_20610 [Planctomycetes bacterium CA13]|uniref:SMI1 / KNR4 family protein n=1 Tax=Novipirellula herctigrandis TaxID=2527986 RepID=A0A5C5Z0T2_9BACT|nr:hypothetical protein CA13_20610 [Planctomycetes bacterium CA13]
MIYINGLLVPKLLIELIAQGRWRHPGDDVLRKVVPPLYEPTYDPVDFLSLDRMEQDSRANAFDQQMMETFKERAGSVEDAPDLPWIDIEKRIFIAVCAVPGADVGIALDYRPSLDSPRVVALCYSGDPGGEFYWTLVCNSFGTFAQDCGL